MRRHGSNEKRQRTAAAILVFFLLAAVMLHAVSDGMLRQAGQNLLSAAERKLFLGAVCAVSPLIGYMLEEEEEEMPSLSQGEEKETRPAGQEEEKSAVSSSQADVVADADVLMEELQQLLLAEQGAFSEGKGQGEGLDDLEETNQSAGSAQENNSLTDGAGEAEGVPAEGAGITNGFPEDSDGEEAVWTDWDADLLAEIERENAALREEARRQAELESAGDSAVLEAPENPEEPSVQKLPLPYAMEQLQDRDFLMKNLYALNKTTAVDDELLEVSAMLGQDMSLQEPDSGGPKVLIHHTHATEYFADSNPDDPSTLIVGVGDYLEELLETNYGIEVIHDTTVYPYNEAYSQALRNVEQILADHPTIEVFIDLHRDAGGANKYSVEIDGKETANLMFFNGTSQNLNGPIDYLVNENLAENLAFSFQMKMAGDSMYPGLCKRNHLKAYRYNLHVLPRALIIEVGDNNNTLQEAKNAMEPLARILNYVLNGEQ